MSGKPILSMMLLLGMTVPALSGLHLKPIHPEESVEETLNRRFSSETALSGIRSICEWLESFRKLTSASKGKIPARQVKAVGNTEWEIQELGFRNIPQTVEGALRRQDLEIRRLQYQIARIRFREGKTDRQRLDQAKKNLEKSEKLFSDFWNLRIVAD